MKEWKNILISFSLISFACAIKNYIIYIFNDSSFFAFLAPSVFGTHNFYITPGFINYLYDLPREVAASERMFKISARYGAALSQVVWDRLPNGHIVKTAHLLMHLSTEGGRPSSRRGQRKGCS